MSYISCVHSQRIVNEFLGNINLQDLLIGIGIAVVSTAIVSALGWFFRHQLLRALTALDMSTGAVLGWAMAFIMLGVVIAFSVVDIEIPLILYAIFPMLVIALLMVTVNVRR